MKFKRGLSLILILGGIILIVSQAFSITGAVMGFSDLFFKFWSFIGIGMVVVGSFMFVLESSNLEMIADEGIVLPAEAVTRIEAKHPGKKTIVVDTSYVASYTKKGTEALMSDLNKYSEVIVPDSVLEELSSKKFRELRPIVEKFSDSPLDGFERYRKPARSYLCKTEKALMYEALHPILDDVLSGKREIKDLTKGELDFINSKTKKLQELAKRDRFDMRGNGITGLYKTKNYLEQHCKVSDTDVDVLATALAEVRYNNGQVVVAEKDVDFEEAIDMIHKRPDRKTNWKLISYETPYALK